MTCTKETARCDTARSYLHDLPDCCRSHMIHMMADMQRILDAAGIIWWMDYGTLLGAVRNPSLGLPPGIIPYDKDGDCGILARDVAKFRALGHGWPTHGYRPKALLDTGGKSGVVEIVQKLPKPVSPQGPRESDAQHFERSLFKAGCSFKVRWSPTNHTNIDYFWWEEREDGTFYRERYVSVDRYKGREFSRCKLFPLIRLEWEGLLLPAPNDPEWFCELRYGKKWRTPLRKNNDGYPRNPDGSVSGEPIPLVG